MKKLIICLLTMGPLVGIAQEKGVHFVHHVSWQEILQEARAENKYIFVDCYATWCGPCKAMDEKVYPVDSVGSFINDRFISVKIQMDTTGYDNEETQRWYQTASQFGQQYQIKACPTFLFFNPDGRAVHKDIGFKDSKDLLSMVVTAMDSTRQYYTLLSHFRQGDKNYQLMPVLADEAKKLGQDSIYEQVARDYVLNYLQVLPSNRRWSTDNISFVNRFSEVIHYQDKIFQSYYKDRMIIDSVTGYPQFSDYLINRVIYRELIGPSMTNALVTKAEPDWNRLEKHIEKNFNKKYGETNVMNGRLEYYRTTKKWNYYVKYFIRQQEEDGLESWSNSHRFVLNNDAYEVFLHSNRRRELEKALSWVNRALAMDQRPYADAMDTKANILYKLGRKQEGLVLEEQTHALSPKDREITANYEKMKKGLPTWVDE
jgi:thiol-disulfide isomerase/thioredoxin